MPARRLRRARGAVARDACAGFLRKWRGQARRAAPRTAGAVVTSAGPVTVRAPPVSRAPAVVGVRSAAGAAGVVGPPAVTAPPTRAAERATASGACSPLRGSSCPAPRCRADRAPPWAHGRRPNSAGRAAPAGQRGPRTAPSPLPAMPGTCGQRISTHRSNHLPLISVLPSALQSAAAPADKWPLIRRSCTHRAAPGPPTRPRRRRTGHTTRWPLHRAGPRRRPPSGLRSPRSGTRS